MTELWIGTNNPKKLQELTRLLAPLGVTLRTPKDLAAEFDPVEDQPDFAGNARKKAALLAELSGRVALADDSGLCVDALDGRPGVLSARYGGPGLDDRGRMLRLLEELEGVPHSERTARFVCSLCVAAPDGAVLALRALAAEFDGRGYARAQILRGLAGVVLGQIARSLADTQPPDTACAPRRISGPADVFGRMRA